MAGLVLNSTAVLRFNFCAKLNICASIYASSPSGQPLATNYPFKFQSKYMNVKNYFLLILIWSYYGLHGQASKHDSVSVGPKKGILFIAGGNVTSDSLIIAFIQLAGGKNAPIVVIPTANMVSNEYNQNSGGADKMRRLGATNVTVIHTMDKNIANTDSFIKPLMNAKAVWFSGGRQWRLVDAYKDTKAERMFWDILDRNGVIGGSSAGATIQGSYLARGDTKNNQIMMG
jgi:hypothetical protein